MSNTPQSVTDTRLIDVEEVARLLAASARTIRRLDQAGKIPSGFRLGGLKRWRLQELQDWIAAGCPPRSHWSWQSRES